MQLNDEQQLSKPPQKPFEAPTEAPATQFKEVHIAADFANFFAPLIDPAKFDTLKGKRAATPRLRKACHRLQMAHISGFDAGMIKLRKGNTPTTTKGPYAGEIVTGDHIIPLSVCPELDHALYNLEMMPLTLNQKKSAKIGIRQIDLARRRNQNGLLSDAGLKAVLEEIND